MNHTLAILEYAILFFGLTNVIIDFISGIFYSIRPEMKNKKFLILAYLMANILGCIYFIVFVMPEIN